MTVREEFEALWTHPEMREHSPSECLGSRALAFGREDCRSLVDVGCGTGRGSTLFRAAGWTVVGCDIAPNAPDDWSVLTGRFVAADAAALPFRDGAADMIFCGDVLDYVPEAHYPAVFREFNRVAVKRVWLQLRVTSDPGTWGQFQRTVRAPAWWRSTLRRALPDSALQWGLFYTA